MAPWSMPAKGLSPVAGAAGAEGCGAGGTKAEFSSAIRDITASMLTPM
jgi:hypothetical protein